MKTSRMGFLIFASVTLAAQASEHRDGTLGCGAISQGWWAIGEAILSIELDAAALSENQWTFSSEPQGLADYFLTSISQHPVVSLELGSMIRFDSESQPAPVICEANLQGQGTMIWHAPDRMLPISNPALIKMPGEPWHVTSKLGDRLGAEPTFDVGDVTTSYDPQSREFRIEGTLLISGVAAIKLGRPYAAGLPIGSVVASGLIGNGVQFAPEDEGSDPPSENPPALRGIGPDVIVGDLPNIWFWGTVQGIGAFSIGTVACNAGDEWLDWIWNTNAHPVISQSLYRLKNDRFEQIGMSWLKHGFFAVTDTLCSGPNQCQGDPSGNHLGVGCSDPYSAWLNGQQSNLSPRSIVNPHTGVFGVPWSAPPAEAVIGRRLQVAEEKYDPDQNLGALYFAEGHYLTRDDAFAGNQDNNASYRPLTITGQAGAPILQLNGSTARTRPAIRGWRDTDPDVVETDIEVRLDGLFILSAKAIDLDTGFWRYEYALFNLNSDRSCRAFSVPVDSDVAIQNVGFHDVDHHSGEPYDGTDWPAERDDSSLSWATDSYEIDRDANALRYGTLYNFWFEADAPPQPTRVTLTQFRVGSFPPAPALTVGPAVTGTDCNNNGLHDLCDLDCALIGSLCDVPGCGESNDLDGNGIPDDCQPDCNENQVPDALDISAGDSLDCNSNVIPDECEQDADLDGSIDECDPCPGDPTNDADGDGTCAPEDQCPEDPFKLEPGLCGCNRLDLDPDGDGVCFPDDLCPFDDTKTHPGVCGCGQADEDSDGDGVLNCLDGCPYDSAKLTPGACGCGASEIDSDVDTIPDCIDLCPGLNDGIDTDADGVPDCAENVPVTSTWGLVVLGLLFLIAAKLGFRYYPLNTRGRMHDAN